MTVPLPPPAPAGVFRARWPIFDESLSFIDLIRQAEPDLPLLTARARARLTGPGRWFVAYSHELAGSGNLTRFVLVFDADAVPRKATTEGRVLAPVTPRRRSA